MLKPCGLLARFVVRSCGFLAAKDGVGPIRPFCSLKTSTGKLFGEKIGLKHWTRTDVRRAVSSLVSLQLAAVLPHLDVSSLFGVERDTGAALYCWVAPCAY